MLYLKVRTLSIILICLLCLTPITLAQEQAEVTTPPDPEIEVVSYKPTYAPPSEILAFLGVTGTGSWNIVEWQASDGWHAVEVRVNAPANLLVMTGQHDDINHVMELIKQADTPPRQIEIEVKIVELFKSKARDVGLDWATLLDRARLQLDYDYTDRTDERIRTTDAYSVTQTEETKQELSRASVDLATARLSEFVRMIDETGAGTLRTAPRVLTLNNKPASILDGERVTYITKYSSYTNLFEVDSMDAGLSLTVTPSLGESGHITMNITAELTSLEPSRESFGGSPVKQGQMIENTVVVKDGESVLLGGRTRMIEEKRKKRFPLLGHILPFLFSREITYYDEVESFVVITPRVVDFDNAINLETRDIIEGQ